jgi:hypothetical protein
MNEKTSEQIQKTVKNVLVYGLIGITVYEMSHILHLNDAVGLFIAFTILLLLQFFMYNKMTLALLGVLAIVAEASQFFRGTINDLTTILPYGAVCAMIFAVLGGLKNEKKFFFAGTYQLVMQAFILYFALCRPTTDLFQRIFDFVPFASFVGMTFFMLSLVYKGQTDQRIVKTVGTAVLFFAFIFLRGFYLNFALYLFEEWVALGLLIAIVITSLIWYDNTDAQKMTLTIGYYLITAILLLHNLGDEAEPICSVIFLIYSFVAIIGGVLKNQKQYWMISLIALGLNLLKISGTFWEQVPWWGFFILVGIIFITIAVFFEKKEKKEEF